MQSKLADTTRCGVLLTLGCFAACSEQVESDGSGGRLPDVILITVDTLRPDHMSLYGYERETTPHIDRWFAEAAIYTRSYSAEARTAPSVASFLTGRIPQNHRMRLFYQLLPEDTPVIADLLPPEYQSAAFVSNMVLTDEATAFGARFDHYDDYVDVREKHRDVFERPAQPTTSAVLSWLEESRDPTRPLFLWVHYIDPHGPYHAPDSWQRSFTHDTPQHIDVNRIFKYMREPGVTDGLAYIDAYDEEIAYLDSEVGRLLEGYAAEHSIDDALVVFSADHGESMMEHRRWFAHGYHLWDEIVRVPLMLRGPGVRAGHHPGLVSGIDIAPSILAFTGTEIPHSLDGINLLAPDPIDPERMIFVEAGSNTHQRRAVIVGDDKWTMLVTAEDRAVMQRLQYDLSVDPHELSSSSWGDSNVAVDALSRLAEIDPDPGGVPLQFVDGIRIDGPKVNPNATPEQLEVLRALGYVE